MAVEIERKFLVVGDGWRQGSQAVEIRQGYLANGLCAVRVRTNGSKAYLTIKSSNRGLSRAEFEYEIPVADAIEMLAKFAMNAAIEKTRHVVTFAGKVWEVDEFHGVNAGLVVAEIELDGEDEAFVKPEWVGVEVTDDGRYANAYLAEHPFKGWGAG